MHTRLQNDGARHLSSSFIPLRALQHLELRFADLPASSAETLARGLVWLTSLKYLDLSECRIKDDAIGALIPAISQLHLLKSFDLSSTGIQVC